MLGDLIKFNLSYVYNIHIPFQVIISRNLYLWVSSSRNYSCNTVAPNLPTPQQPQKLPTSFSTCGCTSPYHHHLHNNLANYKESDVTITSPGM